MMHTGDQYEARARAERHYELRRLTKALSGFLFGSTAEPHSNRRHRQAANDHSANTSRAA